MAEYTMKELEFTLFKNDKKEGNQPDYTGKVMINGVEMRTAAWIKQKDGKAFFTGKISEFQTKRDDGPVEDPLNPPTAKKAATPSAQSSEDLPF